jgi:hypothetical protein
VNAPNNIPVDKHEEIPFFVRYAFVVLAALIACAIVIPGHGLGIIGSVLCFPLGALRWVHLHEDRSGIFICIAWAAYGGLAAATLQSGRLGRWLFIYGWLLLLVIIGAVGCRRMLSEAQHQSYGF